MSQETTLTTGLEGNWSDENRRVLGWVAELLNGNSRETALMELSKKREQVPELALIIWHSFGQSNGAVPVTITHCNSRCHDLPASRDHFGLPATEPISAHGSGLQPCL